MVAYFSNRTSRAASVAVGIVALCAVIASYAITSLSGTKTGAVLGAACTLGPVLLFVAVVAPVAFPFGLYALLTPFDNVLNLSDFGTLTRMLGIAAAGALLFYMIRTKRFRDPDRSIVFWVLYLLWASSSLFWAVDANVSMDALPTAFQLFGLYLIVAMMRVTWPQLKLVVTSTIAGGALASIYTLYLYHNGMANFKDRLWLRTDTVNLNPDNFASALLLPVTLAIVALLWTRSWATRIAALAALAVMLPTITLSGSRGAELGFAVIVVYLFIRAREQRLRVGISAGVMAALGVIASGPSFFTRWADALSSGGAGRTDIWKVGWRAFKEHWLFGAGYNNFKEAYDQSFIQTFQPFFANWHRDSHNILLSTGVELGVVGLVLLVLAWYSEFRVLRNVPRGDARFPLRLGLEASVLALFLCGLFANLMLTKYVWLAFMLVVLTKNTMVQKNAPVPEVSEVPVHA